MKYFDTFDQEIEVGDFIVFLNDKSQREIVRISRFSESKRPLHKTIGLKCGEWGVVVKTDFARYEKIS